MFNISLNPMKNYFSSDTDKPTNFAVNTVDLVSSFYNFSIFSTYATLTYSYLLLQAKEPFFGTI